MAMSAPMSTPATACWADYDYTAQHLHKYQRIARNNRLFISAEHYTNSGGAVAVRNHKAERFNILTLRRKWPGVFLDQRRKDEVMMRWDMRDVCLGGEREFVEGGEHQSGYLGKGPEEGE
jgi:hypothetical protein